MLIGLIGSGARIATAAEKEEARLAELGGKTAAMAPRSDYTPPPSRPALVPALYASLGAMQAWDLYSTRAALKAGAREVNPTVAPIAGNAGAMIAVKAAATAGTIVLAERMWKKNKVGTIVMLAAVNGATAAVSMHNLRNARQTVAR
jgi:hypothetical protein